MSFILNIVCRGHVWASMPQQACKGQKTALWSQVSPNNFTWVLDQTCGSYTFNCCATSLAHHRLLKKQVHKIKSYSVNYSMKRNNTRPCFLMESTQFSFHGCNEGPEQHEILPSVAMAASYRTESLGLYTMEEVLDPSVHRRLFWGSLR